MDVKPAEAAPESDDQGGSVLPEGSENNPGQRKGMRDQPGALFGRIARGAACRNQIGNRRQHKPYGGGQQNHDPAFCSRTVRTLQRVPRKQQEQKHQAYIDRLDPAQEKRAQHQADIISGCELYRSALYITLQTGKDRGEQVKGNGNQYGIVV